MAWLFIPCALCRDRLRREVVSLEHDPEKWEPVFGKRSCSNNKLERDDDSKKSHPALGDTGIVHYWMRSYVQSL